MERIEHRACFGGSQDVYRHESSALGCAMNFAVYLPPQAERGPCPVLYWLSGLTCTEQNFITKAGAQQFAAEHGVILVAPDTSPRGEGVPDAEGYDLGQGAGFYVDATALPWARHYRMYDYVSRELPELIEANFPATSARGISGHSMGGHGALVIALRNPGRYRSVSAFSPIVAPSQVPWGEKALGTYLGPDRRPAPTATWPHQIPRYAHWPDSGIAFLFSFSSHHVLIQRHQRYDRRSYFLRADRARSPSSPA